MYTQPKIIKALLQDHSTAHNIIYANSSYLGHSFADEIALDVALTFKSRKDKCTEDQVSRKDSLGEVFTPHRVVKTMTKDYVDALAITDMTLEICCGEAPFVADIFDMLSGEPVAFDDRAGVLDIKCRQAKSTGDITAALMSTYGYELQGDSLFLARQKVIRDAAEWHEHLLGNTPGDATLEKWAEIISWNFWQMDGITCKTPSEDEDAQADDPRTMPLWGDSDGKSPVWAIVAEWKDGKPCPTRFVDSQKVTCTET